MINKTFFSRNVRLFQKAISLLGSLWIVFSFAACNTGKKKGIYLPLLVRILQNSQASSSTLAQNQQPDNPNSSEPPQDNTPPQPPPTELRVFCNYESKYVHVGATITYTTPESGAVIFVGSSTNINATEPDTWVQTANYTFTNTGTIKLFAKPFKDGNFLGHTLNFVYEVVNDYPTHTTEGIPHNSSSIVAWADGYEDYVVGADVNASWQTPNKALGSGTSSTGDIVSLGNHGRITLKFSMGIKNGAGYDFVVFENGFISGGPNNVFAELGYVEVSSDGTNFVRFDNVSRTANPVGAFQTVSMLNVHGLAGLYPVQSGVNYGVPFDLNWLRNKEKVVNGLVDLNNIKYVRIIDISGAPDDSGAPTYYRSYDSFGNVIYDPYKTVGSGGVDLESIGVIHKVN